MKLRIRSDGTPQGTRVETEDGELVRGITRVTLILDVRERPTAVVTLVGIDMDLDAQAVDATVERPREGPLKALFAKTAEDDEGR